MWPRGWGLRLSKMLQRIAWPTGTSLIPVQWKLRLLEADRLIQVTPLWLRDHRLVPRQEE